MPDGPTVRRRRLGAELRRLRDDHGMKLDEVATRLGLVASTLSRIETGKAPIRTRYLGDLLDLYGVTDIGVRRVLLDMAREGHRKGWWSDYDDVLPSGFDVYVGLEAEARALRAYDVNFVHGLLQTSDYAAAILRGLHPRDSEEQIQRTVDLRLLRQRKLDEDPPLDLWLILDEAAIRRRIGGTEVMRGQLEHLIAASAWPNVTLQVMAFDIGAHAGVDGPFAILQFELTDPDVACAEGMGGIVYLEKDREVRACAEAFDRMRASALSPEASLAFIRAAKRELLYVRQEEKSNQCKESQMDDLRGLRWFKSRASGGGGCVEVAHLPEGGVALRDTKDRSKAPHVYTRPEWEAFLIGVKNGEFDVPEL